MTTRHPPIARRFVISACAAIGLAISLWPMPSTRAAAAPGAALSATVKANANASANADSDVLRDLHDVSELKALFNQDRGKVRLVLLLSPT